MSKVWRFRMAMSALTALVICGSLTSAEAKKKPKVQSQVQSWESDPKFNVVVDKICTQELLLVKNLHRYSPMVETYIQNMRPDKDLGTVPVSDQYFLGRVRLQTGCQRYELSSAGRKGVRVELPSEDVLCHEAAWFEERR